MKLLVVGIDGGTEEIISGMPMPFMHSILERSSSKKLDEDLISRGWAEALTGEHASTNKGLYLMPCSDGSYDFSGSYSKSDMVLASSNKVIWKALNDKGVSVGIVNVPTTGPADEVKGFIVAGGGGGVEASGGVPDGMVYPPKYTELLEKNKYVFDIRLPGGEKTVSAFLKKIRDAEQVQKNTFIELSKKEKPEFGFHCFRITTEVQYLARYEIDKIIKKLADCKYRNVEFLPKTEIQKSILDHYKSLDEAIKSIFEELNPENFILMGDHSTALFEKEGNLDVWLAQKGYLSRLSKLEVFWGGVRGYLNRKVSGILGRSRQKKASLIRRPITKFSQRRTKAFGTFYDTGNFAGIFINDKCRFGGPIESDHDTSELVNEICGRFNSDPLSREFSLEARPYRKLHADKCFQDLMPDIKIHKSDSIYFSSRKWEFMSKNSNLKPLDESLSGVRYPHTGAKGKDPLFVYSRNLDNLIRPDDPNDLRITYHLISRFFDRPN